MSSSALAHKGQLTFDTLFDPDVGNVALPRDMPSNAGSGADRAPTVPSFDYGGAFAASSRRAGRINAASVSKDEINALLAERQRLLDAKFDGVMTRKQEIRLEYVRWSLDRIEDARFGMDLDQLESAVMAYEAFSADVSGLLAQLDKSKRRGR